MPVGHSTGTEMTRHTPSGAFRISKKLELLRKRFLISNVVEGLTYQKAYKF